MRAGPGFRAPAPAAEADAVGVQAARAQRVGEHPGGQRDRGGPHQEVGPQVQEPGSQQQLRHQVQRRGGHRRGPHHDAGKAERVAGHLVCVCWCRCVCGGSFGVDVGIGVWGGRSDHVMFL